MGGFRSKSCKNPESFRSYNQMSSNGGSQNQQQQPTGMRDLRSYSSSHASSSKGWMMSLADPEVQRKKRVTSYKVYAVEGKMKESIKKSFRWIKSTCSNVVYGSWW